MVEEDDGDRAAGVRALRRKTSSPLSRVPAEYCKARPRAAHEESPDGPKAQKQPPEPIPVPMWAGRGEPIASDADRGEPIAPDAV